MHVSGVAVISFALHMAETLHISLVSHRILHVLAKERVVQNSLCEILTIINQWIKLYFSTGSFGQS